MKLAHDFGHLNYKSHPVVACRVTLPAELHLLSLRNVKITWCHQQVGLYTNDQDEKY